MTIRVFYRGNSPLPLKLHNVDHVKETSTPGQIVVVNAYGGPNRIIDNVVSVNCAVDAIEPSDANVAGF